MYNYKFHKKVVKYLDKWDSNYTSLLVTRIDKLLKNPYSKSVDLDELKDKHYERKTFRLRLGKYRLFFEVNEDNKELFFFHAWPRWDVYK